VYGVLLKCVLEFSVSFTIGSCFCTALYIYFIIDCFLCIPWFCVYSIALHYVGATGTE
jgi:hypothetical protein